MNLVQASIAHAVHDHLRRQWRQMPRNGPVSRIEQDQITFVNQLIGIFKYNNASFDEKAFKEIVYAD